MSGMSLCYSKREKLKLSIETGIGDERKKKKTYSFDPNGSRHRYIKCYAKGVLVDELGGLLGARARVTVCPGLFGRTQNLLFAPEVPGD
jgi:hypothetical protein